MEAGWADPPAGAGASLQQRPRSFPLVDAVPGAGPFHTRGHIERYAARLRETGREDCIPRMAGAGLR